jgi:hypothetical protein
VPGVGRGAEVMQGGHVKLILVIGIGLMAAACGSRQSIVPVGAIAADRQGEEGIQKLVWLERMWSSPEAQAQHDRKPKILAIHESTGRAWPAYTASAYTVLESGAKLDISAELGEGHWQPPAVFSDGQDTFALFGVEFGGSVTFRNYALLHIADEGTRRIPIDFPDQCLSTVLKYGQKINQGRGTISVQGAGLDMGRVGFQFPVWNLGDRDNFPRGGVVDGLMKVERDATGRPERLVVDTWVVSRAE